MICTERGNCAEVNILVVNKKPLGYDLLIGLDATWTLGSIEITLTEEVQLGRKHELCVAITIEEPDFWTTINNKAKA